MKEQLIVACSPAGSAEDQRERSIYYSCDQNMIDIILLTYFSSFNRFALFKFKLLTKELEYLFFFWSAKS